MRGSIRVIAGLIVTMAAVGGIEREIGRAHV